MNSTLNSSIIFDYLVVAMLSLLIKWNEKGDCYVFVTVYTRPP